MGNDEGNANKESPSVALVVPLDTAVEVQAHMELEKEQVPESGEVGKEGELLLSLVTPNRRSRRLEQKRGSSEYRSGQVISNAAKRKATLVDPDPGTISNSINILNLLSDESLLSIAHICDVDFGSDRVERVANLALIRSLEWGGAEGAMRPIVGRGGCDRYRTFYGEGFQLCR